MTQTVFEVLKMIMLLLGFISMILTVGFIFFAYYVVKKLKI